LVNRTFDLDFAALAVTDIASFSAGISESAVFPFDATVHVDRFSTKALDAKSGNVSKRRRLMDHNDYEATKPTISEIAASNL
jgi:hypothetical protein